MIALSNLKKNLKRFQQIFRVEEMKKKTLRKKHSLRFNNLEFKKWKSFFFSFQTEKAKERETKNRARNKNNENRKQNPSLGC